MRPSSGQVFLERSNYKMRRIVDAMRILPFVGVFLWVIPLFWTDETKTHLTSTTMLYIFGVWMSLVLVNFVLSYFLGRSNTADPFERDVS